MKHNKKFVKPYGLLSAQRDIESEILFLKNKMNAVILAHYYQDSDVQDIADFIGDSLELSRKAANIDADVIVFCGVKFMAEVACILNPSKKVIVPDIAAGCSLEQSCTEEAFSKFIAKFPDHVVLSYINCSASIKALSDIIVTSSNAEKIINSLPIEQGIVFAPDKHLGAYLNKKTNRSMKLWDGTCMVHENFSEKELIRIRTAHPRSKTIAHPECPERLLAYADHIGSTSSLIRYAAEHNGSEFIVLTEPGIIHQMHKSSPNSTFFDVPGLNQAGCSMCSVCPFMRLNTLDKVYECMINMSGVVTVDETIMEKARTSLNRMMELS